MEIFFTFALMHTVLHTDQRYIEGLIKNDSSVINEIYKNFSGKIIAFIKNNNGTTDDARDVFQDALMTIYHKAKESNFTLTCPFEAYLFMICKSNWINKLKRNSKTAVTINDGNGYKYEIDKEQKNIDEMLSEYDKMKLYQSKFDQLGEVCKQLITLSWTDMSMEQVAEKMNLTYAFARKKKSECISKLTNMIQNDSLYKQLIK